MSFDAPAHTAVTTTSPRTQSASPCSKHRQSWAVLRESPVAQPPGFCCGKASHPGTLNSNSEAIVWLIQAQSENVRTIAPRTTSSCCNFSCSTFGRRMDIPCHRDRECCSTWVCVLKKWIEPIWLRRHNIVFVKTCPKARRKYTQT